MAYVGTHIGTHTYAGTTEVITDPENGKRRYRYMHWSKLDANLVFTPNHAYCALTAEERDKFVFPPTWDLSEAHKAICTAVPGVELAEVCEDLAYGHVWLLEQVAAQIVLR